MEQVIKYSAIKKQENSIWVIASNFDGGADRDRTGDPQHAMLMLSQLSYSPNININLDLDLDLDLDLHLQSFDHYRCLSLHHFL